MNTNPFDDHDNQMDIIYPQDNDRGSLNPRSAPYYPRNERREYRSQAGDNRSRWNNAGSNKHTYRHSDRRNDENDSDFAYLDNLRTRERFKSMFNLLTKLKDPLRYIDSCGGDLGPEMVSTDSTSI